MSTRVRPPGSPDPRPSQSTRRHLGWRGVALAGSLWALGSLPLAQKYADPWLHDDGSRRTVEELAIDFGDFIVDPQLGIAYQYYDTGVGSPAVQVLVSPGTWGHPTEWERFILQFPHPPPLRNESALVIGFHGFSTTEASIWNTGLEAECDARGYYLLAPLGLDDEHYFNVDTQLALNGVLDLVQLFFDINTQRIYPVGFSMGGGTALSWSMRNQDPDEPRAAAVVAHTATLDLIDTYDTGSPTTQAALVAALGGDPTSAAFQYERVSPLISAGGVPDPDLTGVSNLAHLPIYYHTNLADINANLLAQNAVFKDWLVSEGVNASINEVNVATPPTHSWQTLDLSAALDFVEAFTLPPEPTEVTVHADRVGDYFYTRTRDLVPDEVARYRVVADALGNSFTIDQTLHVNTVSLDLVAAGLDPGLALSGGHSSLEAAPDELVLEGYLTAPPSVTVNGGAPFAWSHDPVAGELSITPTASGASVLISIAAPPPLADFGASVTSGPAPLSVDFSDESFGNVTAWSWDFGDTGTSTVAAPTHVYTTPGTYTVELDVSGPAGSDLEAKAAFITVLEPPPAADFTADVTSGVAPLDVQFTDLTTGPVTDWSWDFGDAGSSTAASPLHTYTDPGTYTVALTATGPGGSDVETKVAYVTVNEPPPAAAFSADVTSGAAPLAVQFTDESTGPITSWAWDFGDTGSSTEASPQHTYTEPGTYTVTLALTGPGGFDIESKVDYVTVTDSAPQADFTADVTSGAAPLTVQFTDLTAGDVTQWDWNFGDLGTSTAQNPQHTYASPGTYTVILAATGPGGADVEVKASFITVN